MKLINITEARKDFTTKTSWVAAMVELGVKDFLREKELNTDLIYAVKGIKLIGTWSPKKKEGIRYSAAGMMFDKRFRKFEKVKV